MLIVLSSVFWGASVGFAADDWFNQFLRRYEEKQLLKLQEVQQHNTLSEFTTDGCSGFQSEGWRKLAELFPAFKTHFGETPPWEHCCVVHDKAYWSGPAIDGYRLRLKADQELKHCVIATGKKLAPELSRKYQLSPEEIERAFAVTAGAMYQAVRIGGIACSTFPWRWGYGWPKCESLNSPPSKGN
jgi:hypothetical protein